ncbi:MAG: hypothetical protein COY42_31875 [Armatimonadetes bacterium CG_4_10_14_0_8_um_filter_66_14]|nr:tetratricopeptide repeat protein [Armatimonadota bacterium]NCQ28463.1 tetratricopeptide repeat protein [Armatimonadota bacterium]PIX41399.1 MAG: hypothetical protein COZ57_23500 [Armatimonadetes bacterium CG_4_8_14_3_um_filter_66_20]PIZ32070.1 MAG: hypothetical protein COY42_31875 [Armatimonadetes bacterium CG_4_10_14_0_8_um_filter_66_14]
MNRQSAKNAKTREGPFGPSLCVSAPLRLCVLALACLATPCRSQPAGPPRPPGGTYNPYQPLIRQGPLPDAVQQALQGILLFPAAVNPRTGALAHSLTPSAVHLKPSVTPSAVDPLTGSLAHPLTPSPVLPITPSAGDPLTGSSSLFEPVRLPLTQLLGPSAVELPGAVAVAIPLPPNGDGLPDPAEVRFRALVQIARTTRLAKRFEEARAIAADLAALATDPRTRYLARLEQAACHYVTNELHEAIGMLRELTQLQAPDDESGMWTRYYLGSSLIKQERWQEAIPPLQDALAQLPEPPNGYWPHMYRLRLLYRTHRCYLHLGDLASAGKCLRQYLAETEKDTEREARANRAAFLRLLALLDRRLGVEGLEAGELSFGKVQAGESASRKLTIYKPWKSGTETRCDVPFVTANVLSAKWHQGSVYAEEVSVEVLPLATPGIFTGEVTIASRAPVEGSLTIPVRGEIVQAQPD